MEVRVLGDQCFGMLIEKIYKINAKMQKDRMGFGSVYHQFCIINPWALRIVQIDPYVLNFINF